MTADAHQNIVSDEAPDRAENILEAFSGELSKMNKSMSDVRSAAAMMRAARQKLEQTQQELEKKDTHIRELERHATIDPLTELKNATGFMQARLREIKRAERGHSSGGIIVRIGFDNSKTIESTYGRNARDAAARLIARILKSEIRGMDTAATLAADEFALLLPETRPEEAATRLQELGIRLNNISLIWRLREIAVNLSLSLESYNTADQSKEDPAKKRAS